MINKDKLIKINFNLIQLWLQFLSSSVMECNGTLFPFRLFIIGSIHQRSFRPTSLMKNNQDESNQQSNLLTKSC